MHKLVNGEIIKTKQISFMGMLLQEIATVGVHAVNAYVFILLPIKVILWLFS